MNYYKVEVNNRYGYIQAYITEIEIIREYTRGESDYKVLRIVAGVNVPERVGRNTYHYKNDGIIDLIDAQRKCILKLFRLKT
jgi:hypothetical protein